MGIPPKTRTKSVPVLVTNKGVVSLKNNRRETKKELKRQLRTLGEKKYSVYSGIGIAVTSAGTAVYDISAPTQGNTDLQRNGDQIQLRSLEMFWKIIGGDATNTTRCIIFQWFTDSNYVLPTLATVLLDTTIVPWISPWNHDNRFDFKILYDSRINTTINGPNVGVKHKRIYKGFKDKIQYIQGGQNGTNKIFMVFVSDSAIIPSPTLDYYVKLNYSDY